MPDPSKQYWDDPATDWSAGEPGRVADLLAHAYSSSEDARRIALTAGLDWSLAPAAASARETWIWGLTEAAAAGHVLDLAAEVLHDPGSSEFDASLGRLLGQRLGEVNLRIARAYGLPPAPTDGPDHVVESIVAADPPAGAYRGELQAINMASAGIAEPRARMQAMLDIKARTAMIRVAGKPAGTGFLVGADLLLTAAHVFDKIHWPPVPPPQAYAVFDFEYTVGRSYAETGIMIPIAEFVTGSLPTAAEAKGSTAQTWDAPEDRLDFALLRLAKPPPQRPGPEPAARGYYPLSMDDYDFRPSTLYWIMQHPLGGFVGESYFYGSPVVNPTRTRIRYGANTLAGASGSAVINSEGQLVALHHYSEGIVNQGVPISAIAQTLLTGEHAGRFCAGEAVAASDAVVRADPFATSAFFSVRPFLNRSNLRDRMRTMAEQGDIRTLAINGDPGTGVSYSYMLASHVADQSTLCASLQAAAPGGLKAVRIDLRSYINTSAEQIRAKIGFSLLMELKIIDTAADPLAQEARDTLSLVARLSARLRGSDQQWWFFFDSIDNLETIKQGEVDELIHALIDLADDRQVPLRIVLAGHKAEEFAAQHTAWAERDYTSGLTLGHVEDWLRQRADEESTTIDERKLADKLAELFPLPALPEPRVLAMELLRVNVQELVP